MRLWSSLIILPRSSAAISLLASLIVYCILRIDLVVRNIRLK